MKSPDREDKVGLLRIHGHPTTLTRASLPHA